MDDKTLSLLGDQEAQEAITARGGAVAVELADCLIRILDWAGREGVDLDAILREKMDYNRTRQYRHGGKKL